MINVSVNYVSVICCGSLSYFLFLLWFTKLFNVLFCLLCMHNAGNCTDTRWTRCHVEGGTHDWCSTSAWSWAAQGKWSCCCRCSVSGLNLILHRWPSKIFFFLRLQLHMWTAIAACMFIICKKKLCRWQVGSKWWTFAQYSLRLFSLDSLLVHSWVQSVWQQTLHNYTLQILEGACFVQWCKYFFFPLLIYLLIRATFNSFISKV